MSPWNHGFCSIKSDRHNYNTLPKDGLRNRMTWLLCHCDHYLVLEGNHGWKKHTAQATRPCCCVNICPQTDEWGKNTLRQNELQAGDEPNWCGMGQFREEFISEGYQNPSSRTTSKISVSNQQPLLVGSTVVTQWWRWKFGEGIRKRRKNAGRDTKKIFCFTDFHCFYYTTPLPGLTYWILNKDIYFMEGFRRNCYCLLLTESLKGLEITGRLFFLIQKEKGNTYTS